MTSMGRVQLVPIGATCKDLYVIHRGILQEKLYSENVDADIYV